jgi:hypothetical protein
LFPGFPSWIFDESIIASLMDARILELFIKENSAWEDMISRQRKEIPLLDKMITGIVEEKKGLKEEIEKVFRHLKTEMHKQEKHMDDLREELDKQQKYLIKERKTHIGDPYSINALFSQKVLRERIKEVEKSFVELKCNYLNYVATI